jgi:hypothetical protein
VGMATHLGPGKQARDACLSRGEPQLVASQVCYVAKGEDQDEVCLRLRCIVTTISRGRSRLWPIGLQYNARHTQIALPSISQGTGIVAGRCSAICGRQFTQNRKEKLSIAWCPDHVVCRTRSEHAGAPSGKAKTLFSTWLVFPEPVTQVRLSKGIIQQRRGLGPGAGLGPRQGICCSL